MSDPAIPTAAGAAKPRTSLSAASLALLAVLTLFWGMNWPVMKIGLAEMPLFTYRAFCLGGAALGMFAIGFARGSNMRLPRGHRVKMAAIALFNITTWNVLMLFGLMLLPAGRTSILAFTMPLWLVVLSALILGERLNGWRLAGLGVGLIGLAVLIGGEWSALARAPLGTALVLSAAVCWAIGTVMIKKFRLPMEDVPFVAWQLLLGGLPIVAAALILDRGQWGQWEQWSAPAWGSVIYNIAIAFVLCHWIWNRLVTTLPAQISGLSTLMIPVVGVFSSMLVLGERPGWPEFSALALISLALTLVLRPSRQTSVN